MIKSKRENVFMNFSIVFVSSPPFTMIVDIYLYEYNESNEFNASLTLRRGSRHIYFVRYESSARVINVYH